MKRLETRIMNKKRNIIKFQFSISPISPNNNYCSGEGYIKINSKTLNNCFITALFQDHFLLITGINKSSEDVLFLRYLANRIDEKKYFGTVLLSSYKGYELKYEDVLVEVN